MKKIIAILMILLINTTAAYAQTILPSVNIIAETNDYKTGELQYAEDLHWTGKEYIFHDRYYGGYKKSIDFVNWEKIEFDNSAVSDKDFYYSYSKFVFCGDRYCLSISRLGTFGMGKYI